MALDGGTQAIAVRREAEIPFRIDGTTPAALS